ncbi:amino acid adenylation enzyme/thioester reductase family protein [Xenococcus sp. PCC 7305]|uniref:non-ribosomal peptide synthetase n=1 Tax=Xenococcus sp. PCC 7305 TaxID=102125 RepID=UPI0002ABB1C9|nr:non-ribosomal peptide synthetase [Xenococcus sp. PCC 7305]ELS00505.1 amino acid adenylation enzyme/thioester reductase family protein [Xenococcus sp. PCC 7305]
MKDFSQRMAALSPAQRTLLEYRLKKKGANNVKPPLISNSQSNSGEQILSSAQERLWLLHQLQPELPLYNEISLVKLTGSLDITLLEQSFNRVIERHQILRSKFIAQEGKPICQIAPELLVKIPIAEMPQQPNSEANAITLATQEARKPFDLEASPLFRLQLYRLNKEQYLWMIAVHHIICDGWSMAIFIREIATVYADLKTGKAPSLPKLSIQYPDFALWEKQLSDKIFDSQLDYWEQQLKGNLPKLELPSLNRQHQTNGINSCRGARESILLSSQLSQGLKALSQSKQVTLFMLLLAAFKLLLFRYTEIEDILVGSPIANRNRPELTAMIGIFLNTLVLRSDLSGDPSFSELLQQVKKVALEAYSHQDLPFEKLVAQLHPERNTSQSPLFQVMFILYNLPTANLELPGLQVEDIPIDNGMALFDLTLEIRDSDRGLDVCFEYNSDRFGANEIQRLLRHYQTILENIVINPDLPLSGIEMLRSAEKQQLLIGFNDNSQDYPVTQTISQLFESQVAKTPNKIAVVDSEKKLTYQELNAQANQIARLLTSLGLQPEEFVSIWQERNANFAIAILGILKAGGVYVPIDSSYPPERIAYILANSESKIVLCDRFCRENSNHILENCPKLKHIVCLDDEDLDSNQSRENIELALTGIDPAYMIYTSGSTGLPKGTIIRHGGAINHIYAEYDALDLNSDLTFLQSAPASSDISVWQFLAPILIGGRTVIINQETLCNPEQLFQVIQQNQITLVELVPVVLRSFIDYLSKLDTESRKLPSLQWMMVTGESVAVDLVNQWLKLYPNIAIVNAYGPSEASDDITQEIITQPLPENSNTVAIGKPLANLNLYILNSNQQLVPVGVPGEICVSGYGVGIGYWHNQEKTQTSFIANPFAETAKPLPGVERDLLYRTGDLGRWLDNGSIEYLGRIDNQVKIRGFRIELGEIETIIARHPLIQDAVVNACVDKNGEKRLVAYYITPQSLDSKLRQKNEGNPKRSHFAQEGFLKEEILNQSEKEKVDLNLLPSALSLGERSLAPDGGAGSHRCPLPSRAKPDKQLREFLKTKLPDYMMPSAWVALEVFPLTPNGKCDRKSLPIPDFEISTSKYIAPRNSTEASLTKIWQEVLNLEQIGIKDNFFELGGHSLLATQVVSKIRQSLAIELPLRCLFEYPTIAELAEQLENSVATEIPLIRPVARAGNLPLSFAQQRLWFLAQLEPESFAYNGTSILELEGKLNLDALSQSINEIVRRHEVLRTSFTVVDGQPRQQIAAELNLDLKLIDLSEFSSPERATEIKRLEQAHTEQPFDLTQSPLFRLTLLRVETNQHLLLMTMHHIICDAWSTGIFIHELSQLYTAFANNQSNPLPELLIQYADFAAWQRQLLQGEFLESQLNYWQRQLNQLPRLNLPTTVPRQEVTTNPSAQETFLIPVELSQAVGQLSRREGVSLFMTMLSVLQILLQHHTSQDDIVVGTDIANRNHGEIESLIGFFVNLLVLRTDLSGNPSFTELLQRVRQITLAAYAHQDLPFDRLVKALQPQRYLSHTPSLFQVLLVLQNTPLPAFDLPGLSLKLREVEDATTRFDLALFLQETETGIVGEWQYNSDLFTAKKINRLSNHFQTLLGSVIATPDARLNNLQILSDREIAAQNQAKQQKKISKLAKFKAIKTK